MLNRMISSAVLCCAAALSIAVMAPSQALAQASGDTVIAARTFAKLRAGEPTTIVYFGGSITAGSGASNGEKTSYRALTTTWLKEQFPKAQINAVNAAIGGTGSDLGAFRCGRDVLVHKPDLVFVEYAVNDGGTQEQRAKQAMEGIVRQIRKANNDTDIVFIYTTSKGLYPPYEKGEMPKAVAYHAAVADYYGIPQINVGKALYEKIAAEQADWNKYLPDNVHPNDAAYAIYTDAIKAALTPSVTATAAPAAAKPLPKPLTERPMETARIVDVSEASASEGWDSKEPMLVKMFSTGLASDKPGAEFTFKFNGTTVGLFWVIAGDSGDISYSIDGGEAKNRSSWDKYALKFNRKGYVVLTDTLAPGEHTMKVKILETNNKESKGTWIRIGSFLVN